MLNRVNQKSKFNYDVLDKEVGFVSTGLYISMYKSNTGLETNHSSILITVVCKFLISTNNRSLMCSLRV